MSRNVLTGFSNVAVGVGKKRVLSVAVYDFFVETSDRNQESCYVCLTLELTSSKQILFCPYTVKQFLICDCNSCSGVCAPNFAFSIHKIYIVRTNRAKYAFYKAENLLKFQIKCITARELTWI